MGFPPLHKRGEGREGCFGVDWCEVLDQATSYKQDRGWVRWDERSTPWKIKMEPTQNWRFGSQNWRFGSQNWRFGRWFSFSIRWFLVSMLIFRGVWCCFYWNSYLFKDRLRTSRTPTQFYREYFWQAMKEASCHKPIRISWNVSWTLEFLDFKKTSDFYLVSNTFILTLTWGDDPIWQMFFQVVEKPPTIV